MRLPLPAVPLLLASLCGGADDRGELRLDVRAAGITDASLPVLMIGAPDPRGLEATPPLGVRHGARWLPDADDDIAATAGHRFSLHLPRSDAATIVVAALRMPWRPYAVERDGRTLTVRGWAIDPDAAPMPEIPGETAGDAKRTHAFAIAVGRLEPGDWRIALAVDRQGRGPERAGLRLIGSAEAARSIHVDAEGDSAPETDQVTLTRAPAPDNDEWALPIVEQIDSGGGDTSEGVASVGALDPAGAAVRPPRTVPAKPGDPLVAVVVTPVLQSGEWAQLRSVRWLADTCILDVAVFHDNGPREKNVPHRDALIVPLTGHAGPQAPRVVVSWRPLLAELTGGLYRRQPVPRESHGRTSAPERQIIERLRPALQPDPVKKPDGDF